MNHKRTLQQIIGIIIVMVLILACGALQSAPTQVPPTDVPPTEVPPTSTPTEMPTPTPKPQPFSIQDTVFEAEYEEHKTNCKNEVDVEAYKGEDGKLYFLFGGEMVIPLRGSGFVLWCYGAEHTWIGEATYEGYTFASNENNPLRFKVDKNKGYEYISGEGSITMPDGTKVTLPRYK